MNDAIREHIEGALGLPVAVMEPLGVSAYNHHYRVRAGGVDRHMVVYNLPPELPLNGIRFEHAIIRHLRDRGYAQAPELVVHDGESLFRVGDVFYALTEWIEGCHETPDLPVSDAQLAASGAALAGLHRATAGFTGRLDYFPEHVFVYTTPHFLDAFDALVARLHERLEKLPELYDADARTQVPLLLERARPFVAGFDKALFARVRAADPSGLVHGDYRRLNIVYGPGEVRKVLDYNCCFNDIRLWDVAYSALSFGGKETVGPLTDPASAAAFIRAYDAAWPLTADERRLLPDYLVFVVVKLMTAAFEGWWITDRTDTLARLLDGQAAAIVRDALGAPE